MRILVVEDDRAIAAGLRAGLEAEGFAVDVATDGVDGLWMGRENAYDVVVLDLMLPGLDGHEVCRQLRDARVWTPILVLTARDAERDEVTTLDTGADDYLAKPFSYAVLLARLRSLMRRGTSERPAVLAAGDLRLDPATRRVWWGGVEVQLTVREIAVLEFMLRSGGAVVSKRTILDHVWGDDFEGDSNIVEVYVRHLRTKLEPDMIETVRGAGYRVVAREG